MIKGVNRQIIEVVDTKNMYFERALLVVRPNCGQLGEKRLATEADRMTAALGSYSGLAKKRRSVLIARIACGLLGALVGGLLVFFCR